MTGPIRPLDPATYERHAIHGEGRAWAETNCYVDVLVELLHGLGFEPIAALPVTFRIDFEGDQWTFFKFPHADLLQLYGLDVQELNPWRSLVHHIDEQVALGRPVLVELDSFFLPDTQGTAYQLDHVKSTVAVNEIDIDAGHMGYFHGQGYFHVEGTDFENLFQIDGLVHERMLPPYIEYLKQISDPIEDGPALVHASLACLRHHLKLVPSRNPFRAFRKRFEADLAWLLKEPLDTFHQYSFATLRQYGACFELAETYLRWLATHGVEDLSGPLDAMSDISNTAKALQFQLARAVTRGRELSLDPVDQMAERWEDGIGELRERFV